MPRALSLTAVCFVALVLSPGASAGTHLDAGIARIEIQDQRAQECHSGWFYACEVDFSDTSDPGNATIDTGQNVSYIGVGASVDSIAPLGLDYNISGEEGYVPNPIMPFVGQTWMNSPYAPGLPGVLEMRWEDQTIRLYYNYVTLSDPEHPIYWHETGQGFPDGQNQVGYDQIGPFNELGTSWDTDALILSELEYRCYGPTDTRECYEEMNNASAWQKSATPDVRYGLDFHQVEAASNASVLRNASYASPAINDSPAYSFYHDDHGPGLPRSEQTISHPVLHASGSPAPFNRTPVETATPRPPPRGVAMATTHMTSPPPNTTLAQVAAGACGLVVLAILLYARIRSRKEAIASATRCRIYEIVARRPGISPTALAKELNLTRNGVIHHLRIMERTQIISRRTEGKLVFLFVGRGEIDSTAILLGRAGAHSVILQKLRERPEGMQKSELVAATSDLPKRTRNHALKRLLDHGLVSVGPGANPRIVAAMNAPPAPTSVTSPPAEWECTDTSSAPPSPPTHLERRSNVL
jgi:DNA-binding transcriptional ArsR family regulator